MANDLASIIRAAAAKYGVPEDVMLRIAQLESGMNPSAANPNSSARGVYQFMTRPGGSWGEYGRGGNPLDPHANVDAGARYIKDNMVALEARLGRAPLGWETYLAHQQGRAGAPALLANPQRPAAEVLSAFYKDPKTARDAIALNAGNPDAPAADFANLWKAKYEGTAVPGGGGRPAGTGPDVAAGDPRVTNPAALAAYGPAGGGMGSIFADMLKPPSALVKPVEPLALVRKPKSVSALVGELGAPVQLSSGVV